MAGEINQNQITTAVTTPNTVASNTSLSVPSTQVLPSNIPNLKVGDSLQFIVRSINANGIGTLYLFGQLIQAKLPNQVQVGDRVRAEILKQDTQIILKIKEILNTKNPLTNESAYLPLANIGEITKKVEDILIRLNPYLPSSFSLDEIKNTPNNIIFPELNLIDKSPNLVNLLKKLKDLLPTSDTLENAPKLAKLLKQISSGELSNSIKDISKEIGKSLEYSINSKEDRFLLVLRDKIVQLLLPEKNDLKPIDSKIFDSQIAKLINALSTEIEFNIVDKDSTKLQGYVDFLKVALTKLKFLNEKK